MLVTLEETRKMICPLLSAARDEVRYCKGNRCMWWRWTGILTGPGGEQLGYCGIAKSNHWRPDGSGLLEKH